MKKPQSGIMGLSVVAALFLAVAGTLPLAAQDIPASSVMPPGYLQAMPTADRVLSDMKVTDSVETRARRIAAMDYLEDIMSVLTWDHLYVQSGSGLTSKEDSLTRGYRTAWNELFHHSGDVPGLTALIHRYSAESSPLRGELLDRYFSPAWKAALMALDARYRVIENPPPTVRAEQRTPPATVQAEQPTPYVANLRCTSGATGAHGKPVSGLEKEACDMAMAEIGKHWAKQPDGWTTAVAEETGFASNYFIRQVRSLAVERVRTDELSAADNLNGIEWAGVVSFSSVPMREAGDPGLVSGRTVSVMRPQEQWSQWVDYQPPPLRVQRVKGAWQVDPNNRLLQGMISGVTGVGSTRPQPTRTSPLEEQYRKSMKSDLRNLVTAEEAFFAKSVKYTDKVAPGGLVFRVSVGNRLLSLNLTEDGWTAKIGNAHTRTVCVIYIGRTPIPPATREGEPACQ